MGRKIVGRRWELGAGLTKNQRRNEEGERKSGARSSRIVVVRGTFALYSLGEKGRV